MSSTTAEDSSSKVQSFLISPQLGAICGILGPTIGFLAVGIAILLSP